MSCKLTSPVLLTCSNCFICQWCLSLSRTVYHATPALQTEYYLEHYVVTSHTKPKRYE